MHPAHSPCRGCFILPSGQQVVHRHRGNESSSLSLIYLRPICHLRRRKANHSADFRPPTGPTGSLCGSACSVCDHTRPVASDWEGGAGVVGTENNMSANATRRSVAAFCWSVPPLLTRAAEPKIETMKTFVWFWPRMLACTAMQIAFQRT